MSAYGKLNLLLINSIYFVFSSLEMHGRLIQTKLYYKLFHFVYKETSHKPSKVALAATKTFSQVRMLLVQVASIFFTLCNDWKTLFFIQIHRYPEVFSNPILLHSLKQVF